MPLNNHCIKSSEIILFRSKYQAEVCLILTVISMGCRDFLRNLISKKRAVLTGGPPAANQEQKKVKEMFKKIAVGLVFLILLGCQQEKAEWNPIFEETSFEYFNSHIERSLALIDSASSEADRGNEDAAQEKMEQAKNSLLQIKDYYIPLTMVRQNIYDAERYFKLKDIKKAEKLLNDSISMVTSLDVTTKNTIFDKVILDLTSMTRDVMTSLNEGSKTDTYTKMKALGEHVNLMLSRGDLVLSGIKFDK